jgi:hypothetical protein
VRSTTFRRRLKIAFDGSPARPAIDYSVSPPADGTSSAVATVRLTGDTLPARCLTWSYAWTSRRAPDRPARGSEHQATEWLEGGDSSAPMAVTEDAPANGSRPRAATWCSASPTSCRAADHVLFVLGIIS